jgi:microcystin-dependent protein
MAEAVLGQKGTGLGNNYNLYAYGEQRSRDTANNRSKVYVEAKLTSGNTNWSSGYASYIRVYWHDNRENYDRLCFETAISSCGYNSSYYASGEIWVTHKDDGSLSGYVYATFTKGGTSGYAPSTGGVTTDWTALWTVPRASTPSINGTIYTGTTVTINTNRASSSFTHVLSYKYGELTGYINNSDTTKIGASTSWAIPANFAAQFPNANKGTCTITCDTYNGSTKIGTKTYNKDIYINTSLVPTISAKSVVDGNSAIKNLNWGVYLVGKSYPVLSITAAGIQGSSISTYHAKINTGDEKIGTTVTELNTKIRNEVVISGTNTIKIWVTDSRGAKSTEHSVTFTGRVYSSPQISAFNVARCKSSSDLTEDDEGTSVKLSAAGSIIDVKNSSNTSKNVMYAKTRYRVSPNGTWSSLTNLSGNVSGYSFDKTGNASVNLAGTFPTTSKYDVELYVYDTVMLTESGWNGSGTPTEAQLSKLTRLQKSILTGFDLMHFHKNGKSVAFGKKSEAGDTDKWFEVRMDHIKFEGNVTVNGNPIENLPIGTILPYSSTTIPSGYMVCDGGAISREDYSELFDIIGTTYGSGDGSTTFNLPNLKGRIPVGQDTGDATFDEVGETGGEKTHKLTIDEIPSHTHAYGDWIDWYAKGGSHGIIGVGTSVGSTSSTGGGKAHNNLQPYIVLIYIIKVARGNATVPSSVVITNADVLQITQNKNDITNLKNSHKGDYVVLRRNIDLTWYASGQTKDKFPFNQLYSSSGNGLSAYDSNQRVKVNAGVSAVRVTYHLNKNEEDLSSNWIMGYIYKNNTVLKRSITKADKWAQLDDTMIIPVQEGDIIGIYVQTDRNGNIVFRTYDDSFGACGGMQVLNVEVVK